VDLSFDQNGWEDYLWWVENKRGALRRINRLIQEALHTPFTGAGKPEILRHTPPNTVSRRIDGANRLVYRVHNDRIVILQARFHYDDT
jgi:toxin YoeB